jgi:cystathionine beta-lyase
MNIIKAQNFLKEYLPQIKLINPEGTYLLWLDFSALGLSDDELNKLIIHEANLWLDKGTMFGEEGSGFQRINIACPWSLLETALLNLQKVFAKNNTK